MADIIGVEIDFVGPDSHRRFWSPRASFRVERIEVTPFARERTGLSFNADNPGHRGVHRAALEAGSPRSGITELPAMGVSNCYTGRLPMVRKGAGPRVLHSEVSSRSACG